MTQHPADPLVEKVARAIHVADKPHIDKLNAPFSIYGAIAQAALAAIREGHVILTRARVEMILKWGLNGRGYDACEAISSRKILTEALTQHDGAKDA
jgi:hypothetical protein